jgi:hypothetical protein
MCWRPGVETSDDLNVTLDDNAPLAEMGRGLAAPLRACMERIASILLSIDPFVVYSLR